MPLDELNAPLGQDKPGPDRKKKRRLPTLPVSGPQVLAGLMGLFGLVVVAWALIVNDPLGGEPTAVVSAKAPSETAAKLDDGGKPYSRHDGSARPGSADATAVTIEKGTPPPPGSKTAPAASVRTSSFPALAAATTRSVRAVRSIRS